MDTIENQARHRPAGATRPRVTRSETRIVQEPAFVLHSYPYKETSLILDTLTRHYGRVAIVARGAKRPRSALRGVLLAFTPLTLSWSAARGRTSELANLSGAEWMGGIAPLRGEGLVCGFYLNELLIKLLARDDAHEALFDAYRDALARLGEGGPREPILRAFEYALLKEAGYAVQLTHCATSGVPIETEAWYRYLPLEGPVRVTDFEAAASQRTLVRGKTLIDIEANDYSDPATLAQSKFLSRQLLQHHLAGATLHTRQLMLELHEL